MEPKYKPTVSDFIMKLLDQKRSGKYEITKSSTIPNSYEVTWRPGYKNAHAMKYVLGQNMKLSAEWYMTCVKKFEISEVEKGRHVHISNFYI